MVSAKSCRCNNFLTCIFAVSFVLVFSLFILYKYTLVDADAVLRKNWMFSSSDDYDDYGIDLSELRRSHSEDSSRESAEVAKWDAMVTRDAGVRMAYITDNCGM